VAKDVLNQLIEDNRDQNGHTSGCILFNVATALLSPFVYGLKVAFHEGA
jgi:hypothetical protein